MRKIFGKTCKCIFYIIFLIIFLVVIGRLFFEKETNMLFGFVKDKLYDSEAEEVSSLKKLRVIYPDEPISLEPTLADPITRQRLVNIYEPLVKPDRDLHMRPSLALSWGMIDDYTWEFILRPNVLFHDSSSFEADDVVASINRAASHPKSELKGVLKNIEEINVLDKLSLRIKTKEPDPLMLQKISKILIIPSEYEEIEDMELPVGTASYEFFSWVPGDLMILNNFERYWDGKAKFEVVELYSRVDKSERVNMFLKGEADLLAFVPYDVVYEIETRGYEIATIPTLEVQFLLLNIQSQYLRDVKNREAVSLAVDQDSLVEAVGGYAVPVSQFVSSGVFGFNPNISEHKYDIEESARLASETGLRGKTLMMHLPVGLNVLGEHVRKSLSEAGIFVVVSYLEIDKLLESLNNREADIYFFGFKSELGDSEDFLSTIVKSGGSFNVFGYENSNVNRLVDLALVELDPQKRRDYLQEAMQIVVEENIIGIPLFEYETVYSFSDKLDVEPRIDGLIYFDELMIK